jgi:hypothetical protein
MLPRQHQKGVRKLLLLLGVFGTLAFIHQAAAEGESFSHPHFVDVPSTSLGGCLERQLPKSLGYNPLAKTSNEPKPERRRYTHISKRTPKMNPDEIFQLATSLEKLKPPIPFKKQSFSKPNIKVNEKIEELFPKRGLTWADLYDSVEILFGNFKVAQDIRMGARPMRATKPEGSAGRYVALPVPPPADDDLTGIDESALFKPSKPDPEQAAQVATRTVKEVRQTATPVMVAETAKTPKISPERRPGSTVLANTQGIAQRRMALRRNVGDLIEKGFVPNFTHGFDPFVGNIKNHPHDAKVQELVGIVNNDYHGNYYDAYVAAHLDPKAMFERGSNEYDKPYKVSDLVRDLKAVGSATLAPRGTYNISEAVALEAPPEVRNLRSLVVRHLIEGDGTTAEEIAKKVSVDLGRRVDAPAVLVQERALIRNRTILDYLKVPAHAGVEAVHEPEARESDDDGYLPP